MRASPLYVDLSFPDAAGGLLVVDQVVVGDITTVQRETTLDFSSGAPQAVPAATQLISTLSPTNPGSFTVPYVQVRQELRVLLVNASDLEANGPNPSPPAQTLTIFVVFNVALKPSKQTQGGGPMTML